METPAKKRKLEKPQKKWLDSEVVPILDYIIQHGNLEKPTAQIYYLKLLKATNLDASWDLVRWKVRNLKRQYEKAVSWKSSTGDDECSTIRVKLCPHYKKLSQIFGGKNSADNFETLETVGFIKSECVYGSMEASNELYKSATDPVVQLTNPTDFDAETASIVPSSPPPTAPHVPAVEPTAATHHAAAEFSKKMKKSVPKSAIQQLCILQTQRLEFNKKKLEIETRKLELEERKVERELRLQEEKLKQDFEIRKLELEMKERLAKYEVDINFETKFFYLLCEK